MAEHMFLGLRMSDGVSFEAFNTKFGTGLMDVFGQELGTLRMQGLVAENSSGFRLTRRGMLLSNQVFMQFLR
jgi:oxygen-independent coproporphyrinogen-3 oxidase